MDLRADGPHAAGRALAHGLQDVLGRPAVVGRLHDVERHFRVHDDADAGMLLSKQGDLLHRESCMDRAVPLPQQQLRRLRLFRRETAAELVRIPHLHAIERHAHLVGRVAAQVLIGQEQNPLAARPRPLEHGARVAGRADDAAVFADEGFDRRRRVDVGDRDDRVDVHRLELLPADLEIVGVGHVGHRAAGGEVGEDHLLARRAQDVRALGHEVHAAEDDEVGLSARGDLAREAERVADEVGELDHLIALVVVAKNEQPRTERRPGRRDAAIHLLVGEAAVPRGQRLTLVERGLLDFVQDGQERLSHDADAPGFRGTRAAAFCRPLACELVKLFSSSAEEKSQPLTRRCRKRMALEFSIAGWALRAGRVLQRSTQGRLCRPGAEGPVRRRQPVARGEAEGRVSSPRRRGRGCRARRAGGRRRG